MTTTVSIFTAGLDLAFADARAFAAVLVIVTLVALMLQREMIRHRPHPGASAGASGLTAMVVPLGIAWAVIIAQRFLDLLS